MAINEEVADSVKSLYDRLAAMIKAHGWAETISLNSFQGYLPSYSIAFIFEYIAFTEQQIRGLSSDFMERSEISTFIQSVPQLVGSIPVQQFPNDPSTTLSGLMMTLNMINSRLPSDPKGPVKLDWESVEDKAMLPRDLSRRLSGVAARLASLEPRASEIDQKISDIEAAHETAEQLPEDLAELAMKRDQMSRIISETTAILDNAKKIASKIDAVSDASVEARQRMVSSEAQAIKLIERSEQALRGSTGVGLAKAFENRQEKLSRAGTFWVGGLVLALLSALAIGAYRVSALQTVLNNDSPSHIVWMNVILTVFGIGGPVWFAWLSTKQISVSFRLAEDYAFKAAVSKAYEGYRSEAISIDPALQERLFSSALDRFEESPIRLMEKETHSSPLQEVLANPAIRKSLEGVPGIANKIIALIPDKGGVAAVVGSAAAVSAAVSGDASTPSKPRAKKAEED